MVTARDRRPVAILAPDPCPPRAVPLRSLPDEPFSLSGLRTYGVVRDERDCDEVLLALARGADVVIAIDLPATRRAALLDDIARIADVREAGSLTSDERAVVDGLVEGRTLTDVARSLGMSRRTATRRLAAAKVAFGAATTMELILAVSNSAT
jgi:DNA-binding NarL/FixJ family response regulator